MVKCQFLDKWDGFQISGHPGTVSFTSEPPMTHHWFTNFKKQKSHQPIRSLKNLFIPRGWQAKFEFHWFVGSVCVWCLCVFRGRLCVIYVVGVVSGGEWRWLCVRGCRGTLKIFFCVRMSVFYCFLLSCLCALFCLHVLYFVFVCVVFVCCFRVCRFNFVCIFCFWFLLCVFCRFVHLCQFVWTVNRFTLCHSQVLWGL